MNYNFSYSILFLSARRGRELGGEERGKMTAKKRYYSDLNFVDDVCKLVIKRICTLIAQSKKEGFKYQTIHYDTFLGIFIAKSGLVRDKINEHFKQRGYEIGYGLMGDKMEVSW